MELPPSSPRRITTGVQNGGSACVLHIVPAPLVFAATPASVLASFLLAHPAAGV